MKKVFTKSFLLMVLSVFIFPNAHVYGTTAEIQNDEVIRVSPSALLRAFQDNIAAANQRYRGRVVEVTGGVDEIRSRVNPDSGREEYVVYIFQPTDGLFRARAPIRSFFLARDGGQIAELEQEQIVTVRGLCIGLHSGFVVLVNSSVVSIGPTRVERSTAREEGVVVNGVRWATRNVGAPGTFVNSPEDAGMLFQWNRGEGWAARGNVTEWNTSYSTSTVWTHDNDPCPEGWRLPTGAELESLLRAGHDFITRNGVAGRAFGRSPNFIFLPATGWRDGSDGSLRNAGVAAVYWSSTQDGLSFYQSSAANANVHIISGEQQSGLPIRCVAGAPIGEEALQALREETVVRRREAEERWRADRGVTFELEGRTVSEELRLPNHTARDYRTIIVVNITVNSDGQVTNAVLGQGTTSQNNALRQAALTAARNTQFSSQGAAGARRVARGLAGLAGLDDVVSAVQSEQQGTITYRF